MRHLKAPVIKSQNGSFLIEGLIAVLIFSMGILAVVGLQAVSMKNTTQAKIRTDASFIATARIGEMWATQGNLASFAEANTPVPDLPDGKRTTVVNGTEAEVTITWKLPGDATTHQYVTIAQFTNNDDLDDI